MRVRKQVANQSLCETSRASGKFGEPSKASTVETSPDGTPRVGAGACNGNGLTRLVGACASMDVVTLQITFPIGRRAKCRTNKTCYYMLYSHKSRRECHYMLPPHLFCKCPVPQRALPAFSYRTCSPCMTLFSFLFLPAS